MACYVGKDGVVKVTGDGSGDTAQTVGEVTNFSLEETAETIECTSMGNTYREYIASYKNWTASMEVHWDPDDNGQLELAPGETVTLALYPEGDGVGDTELSGSAIVTSLTREAEFDGLVTATIEVQGNGALSSGTVSS